MAGNRDTPAMRQYATFKRRHPDCVLFFRMGDFYELFDDDAVTAHKALGITLTQRSEGIPMAGVPFHSAEGYFRRMIAQGFRVAVCDQVQDPREAKGVIERAVTRVLTPGTLVDEALLDESAANTLAAVCFLDAGDEPGGRVGVAVVELSTGAFTVLDCRAEQLVDELSRRSVNELLYSEPSPGAHANGSSPPRVARVLNALGLAGTPRASWEFRRDEALEALLKHYGVTSLAGFGISHDDPAIGAAGAVIRYLSEVQALETAGKPTSEGVSSGTPGAFVVRPKSLAHLMPPKREDPAGFLMVDAVSLRALEVERTIRPNTSGAASSAGGASNVSGGSRSGDGSLLGLFLSPSRGSRPPLTAMGKRLLRDWLCRPLAERTLIEARHAAVGALASDPLLAGAADEALKGVQDVPRIAARVGLGRATPRDLVALGRSLGRVTIAAGAIEGSAALRAHHEALTAVAAALAPIAKEIVETCVEDAPARLTDGGLIRDGIDAALDESRALQTSSGQWLAEYQARLVREHDLPSLKVGYNKIFGFYIELPAGQARKAPAVFSRKQTLKNAERYITPELKDYEERVIHAEERGLRREQEIFLSLCAKVSAQVGAVNRFAQTVAELDVLGCFASRAVFRGWTRPEMTDEPSLVLKQARHPVLEEVLGDRFVPNDCELASGGARLRLAGETSSATPLALLTGPNMAGKSTYIRMVALNVLLAHAGSFVPAEAASVGLADRIFTRIGADDALHAGQSTFMVEMVETANILHHATAKSLVILDEIGRGTSTLDGLSLAWAIAEHLAGGARVGERGAGSQARASRPAAPRTLFATHYHELTDLADRFPSRVRNLQVAVREWGDQVIFLHRILPGRASRSYGIHVAKLAGLPASVVERAGALLETLSVSHAGAEVAAGKRPAAAPVTEREAQPSLFSGAADHPAITELKKIELERMSPMQAFDALRSLKKQVDTPGV
ncbi:MAG: DNA mismatch repair protein MutS [Phycisphaerae bacterium]|nr:DNA mismatch repair protein MutS [Phycisphaerae bacterium]